MPRYIDADRLMTKIHELYVQPNIELWQVLKCVGNSPAADVVPRERFDRVFGNLKAVLEERSEDKAEVAREIFAEIDTMIFGTIIPNDCAIISIAKLAELKKKYTGDQEDGTDHARND